MDAAILEGAQYPVPAAASGCPESHANNVPLDDGFCIGALSTAHEERMPLAVVSNSLNSQHSNINAYHDQIYEQS